MIEIDNHEPNDIIRFIEPVVAVNVTALNTQGYADYFWTGEELGWYPLHDGTYQVERKTATDVAGGADDIETQLIRQRKSHSAAFTRLIIEGGLEPAPGGGVIAYQRASGRDVLVGRHIGKGRAGLYLKLIGQITGWSEFMEVIWTTSYPSTASALVELYKRDQRAEEERSTFRRYFKAMPQWTPNPQVMRLVGAALNDTGIGTELAERIIGVYGTFWAFVHADPKVAASRIRGVSESTVRTYQRKIGRLDV